MSSKILKRNGLNKSRKIFYVGFLITIIPIIYIGFSSFVSEAASSQLSEYEVKAAYLYNFAKFIEWPNNVFKADNSSFIIGILGKDPFGDTIDQIIIGNAINGRKLMIKRFKSIQDVDFCHILFVSSSEEEHLSQILDKANSIGTLTVGDMNSFVKAGGSIGFVILENKVRFEINLESAEKAKLKISSKLLKLATKVKGNRESKGE